MSERFDPNKPSDKNSTSEHENNTESGLFYLDDFREKRDESASEYKKIGAKILNIVDIRAIDQSDDNKLRYVENYATDYELPPLPTFSLVEGGTSAVSSGGDFIEDEPSKTLDARKIVDQLYALNQDVRLSSETGASDQYLMSSVDLTELNLPLGYSYDKENGLSSYNNENLNVVINKSSLVDSFRGDQADEFSEYHSRLLDKRISSETDLLKAEVPKTDSQKAQIDGIINIINNERLSRGQEKLFIDNRFVHFFEKEAWKKKYPNHNAWFDPAKQSSCAIEPKSKIGLLDVIGHELIHGGDYNAITKKQGKASEVNRIGFSMKKDNLMYFSMISEAVTLERLRSLVTSELENNPYYADEVAEAEVVKSKNLNARYPRFTKQGKRKMGPRVFTPDGALAAQISEDGIMAVYGDSYREDRQSLNTLTSKIAKYTNHTNEEVFDMFVDVNVTGNYLPVARIMEKTFGKGSFRKLGENSTNSKDFTKFTKKLGFMHATNKAKQFTKNIFNKFSKIFK